MFGKNRGLLTEALSEKKIKSLISHGKPYEVDVKAFDRIDSTNNEAKRMLAGGYKCRTVIVSAEQTAGRGRQGKSFYSPADTGLYMSVVMLPDVELCDLTFMTSAVAVAVSQAIESVCGIKAYIKWVNDIYINGKKAVGILTEAVTQGDKTAVVVGIGVNISTVTFPDEIADRAGSLGADVSRNTLTAEIADRLFSLCERIENNDMSFLEYYAERSCVIGRKIIFTEGGQEYFATATGIDSRGGLVVLLESGERRTLYGGEISVRAERL